jgi:uncharacterized protein with PQ loop repeat
MMTNEIASALATNSTQLCPYPTVPWIYSTFGECIHSTRQEASFYFGILSLLCWILAQLPQIVTNWKNGSTEGLSLLLLLQWVIADSFNCLGTILIQSLPTQIVVSVYYIFTDIVLIVQYVYYRNKSRKGSPIFQMDEEEEEEVDGNEDSMPREQETASSINLRSILIPILFVVPLLFLITSSIQTSDTSPFSSNTQTIHRRAFGGRNLLSIGSNSTDLADIDPRYKWPPQSARMIAGYVVGFIAGLFYLFSRYVIDFYVLFK